MPITLTVLGASGSYAGPGGACSGYLVQGGGTSLWLDAGPGTLANLQRHLDLDDLDAIVLSHAHPDHWVDVLPYHNVARYIRPRLGLPVCSPARVHQLAADVNGEIGPAFDWRDVCSGDVVDLGGLRVSFSRTDHAGETLAVRITDGAGATLGYSADTGSGWSLAELGQHLDLALCEATLPAEEEDRTFHLTARQAGVSAREAGARHLVLTHLLPGLDPERSRADAAAAFGGPVDVAEIDATYQIGT